MGTPAPTSLYHSLTLRHREEIADHVRCAISTFRGPELDGDDLNDLIRWTLEGLNRTSLVEDKFAEGYEQGRAEGYGTCVGCGAAT